MTLDPLEGILAQLTPENLAALIRDLAAKQPAGARSDVSVPTVMEVLLGNTDLGSPAEAWEAQLRLKQAIADVVAQIPGMEYVEGDS